MTEYIDLDRNFWPVEADKENDPENIRAMFAYGLSQQLSWEDLLGKYRTVILAEPGTGKTEEFKATAKRLRMDGKPAFFCRIELLQSLDVRQSLDIGTAQEFNEWLTGNKEAYFFLDSVDEARLSSHTGFEVALRRFAGAISERSNRAKIFVSCRVSNWWATADLSLFLKQLPAPEISTMRDNEESYTEEKTPTDRSVDPEKKKDHIVFQLAPLNDKQIQHFAAQKGVDDTKSFIEAIERAGAGIFAERPQDLLELIAYWEANGRLGQHSEMLVFNIQKKLVEPDQNRDARRPLSMEDALLGAERLAAAITLQKKAAIILPGQPIDADIRKTSIEPKEPLPDWSSDKIHTLLDRAIFDGAVYRTVRFHHRTVREYLVASWLRRLINEETPRRSVEGLIFGKKYGRDVVVPSMRPVAAWLSLWDDRIRNRLHRTAPEVLIENGDPASLPVEFRKSLLIGFAEHYAHRNYTGVSFDITMIQRLADPQLSHTVNDLLKKYGTHDDVCILLLKLIWQGQISKSVDVALSFAKADKVRSYIRICAIRAVAAAGTVKQKRNLVKSLLTDISKLSSDMLGEVCSMFFPGVLSVPEILKILKKAKTPEMYSASQLQQSIEEIANNTGIPEKQAKNLLQGLHKLLKSEPFIERRHCEISQRYAWLLPGAIKLANQFICQRHDFSLNPIVLDLFMCLFVAGDYRDFHASDRDKLVKDAKAWPEFRHRLFWHVVTATREEDSKKHLTGWWQVSWHLRDFWVPSTDNLERIFEDLSSMPVMDDRSIALTAIFTVYVDQKRPRKLGERMKRAVAGVPALETKLHELLHPKPLPEEHRGWRRQERDFKRKQEERKKQQKAKRQEWQQILKKEPKVVKNVGDVQKGVIWSRTAYLYDRIREKKEEGEHGLGYANWRVLEDEFGFEVAKNFRDGCIAYWREYDPFTCPDRRTSNTIPWPRIIGLTGLAMEATDDPDWAKKISRDEAKIAVHYSVCELSGFPNWFNALQKEFPSLVEEVIGHELRWELHESPAEQNHTHTLSAIRYGSRELSERYRSVIFDLLSEQEPANDFVLDHSLSVILMGQLNADWKTKISKLAQKRFRAATDKNRKFTWLIVLLCVDGIKGYNLLNGWIKSLSSVKEKEETVVNFCAALTDHGNARFGPAILDYGRIEILRELVPLIYKFVKLEDDEHHTGVYTPGTRDHAEQTRSHLLNIIFDTPGQESYEILMNLSKTVSHSFARDRMDYLAKERAALDAEFEPWAGSAVAEFSLSKTRIPRSEADLYELALVRLDNLKLDIEDGDESEAVLLQKLTQETEVRTIFANRLRKSSRSLYTIGSEEELADATRTDIRFNAPQVRAPVPVELKIADKGTLKKLRERLENQLIRQYMRVSCYGVFLLVHNGEKNRWRDPHTNKLVTFDKVIEYLKQDIDDLMRKYPNVAALEIFGIDFTVR